MELTDFTINDAHRLHLEYYIGQFIEILLGRPCASESTRLDPRTTRYRYETSS